MNNNQIVLSSLAMDVKRAALGYYRGSNKMADIFLEEAIKRKDELDLNLIKPYLRRFLKKLDGLVREKDKKRVAEDLLMYSTLFQNAAFKL